MLNLAVPLDVSDPMLMGDDERREFLTPHPRVNHYKPVGITGYRGVVVSGNGFAARIWYMKVAHYLGFFRTAEEAARAYDANARELHGEWALLNFPDEQAA